MNIYDYTIIAAVVAGLTAAIVYIIRQKVKGKNFCCGNCNSCGEQCRTKHN